jgi:hypothetical protein
MATSFPSPLAFKANTALSAFALVALSSNGSIGVAGATDTPVGVNAFDISADSFQTANVWSARGSTYPILVTGAPITAGNLVYAAAAGAVAATGTVLVGIANETVTVNGTSIPVTLL